MAVNYNRLEAGTVPAINNELEKIQVALEDAVSRTGVGPNQLEATVDANSQRIINLPEPISNTEPVRKADFDILGNQLTDEVDTAVANAEAATADAITAANTANTAASNADTATAAAYQAIDDLESDGQAAIDALRVINAGSFEAGATLTARNEVLFYESETTYYRWDGALPKTVPAGSTPATTGGVGDGAWVNVGQAELRSDLADPDKGALLVRGAVIYVDTFADLQALDPNKLWDGQAANVQGSEFRWNSVGGEWKPIGAINILAFGTDQAAIVEATIMADANDVSVFFPSGSYSFDSYDFSNISLKWKGEKGAIILFSNKQEGSKVNIAFGEEVELTGLSFIGGGNVFSQTTTESNISIESCNFSAYTIALLISGSGKSYSLTVRDSVFNKTGNGGNRDGHQDIFSNTNVTFNSVIIENNKFISGGRHACLIMSDSLNQGEYVRVINNKFSDYLLPESGSNTDAQFLRVYGKDVVISGNTFDTLDYFDTGVTPTDVEAIYCQAAKDMIISDNIFIDAGVSEGCITLKSSSSDVIVSNNLFRYTDDYRSRKKAKGMDGAVLKVSIAKRVVFSNNTIVNFYGSVCSTSDSGDCRTVRVTSNTLIGGEYTNFGRFNNSLLTSVVIDNNVCGRDDSNNKVLFSGTVFQIHRFYFRVFCNDLSESECTGSGYLFYSTATRLTVVSSDNIYPHGLSVFFPVKNAIGNFLSKGDVYPYLTNDEPFGSGSAAVGFVKIVNTNIGVPAANSRLYFPVDQSEGVVYDMRYQVTYDGVSRLEKAAQIGMYNTGAWVNTDYSPPSQPAGSSSLTLSSGFLRINTVTAGVINKEIFIESYIYNSPDFSSKFANYEDMSV